MYVETFDFCIRMPVWLTFVIAAVGFPVLKEEDVEIGQRVLQAVKSGIICAALANVEFQDCDDQNYYSPYVCDTVRCYHRSISQKLFLKQNPDDSSSI